MLPNYAVDDFIIDSAGGAALVGFKITARECVENPVGGQCCPCSGVGNVDVAPGTVHTTNILSDNAGQPGTFLIDSTQQIPRFTLVSDTTKFSRTVIESNSSGNPELFQYEVTYDPPISLDQGTYWISYSFNGPQEGGSYSYWLVSTGAGVDVGGAGSNPSYESSNGGATWVQKFDLSFELKFRDCI